MTAGQVAAWETFAGMAFTALVAAAVTVWQGRKTRHTNTREHGNTEQHLLDLHHKVDKVNGKVDRHGPDRTT